MSCWDDGTPDGTLTAVSSLSAGGLLTSSWSFSSRNAQGCTTTIFFTDSIDLNTGAYSGHESGIGYGGTTSICVAGMSATIGVGTEAVCGAVASYTADYRGTLTYFLTPMGSTGSASLSALNPLACFASPSQPCATLSFDSIDPTAALNSPGATTLAADGTSAVVLVFSSTDGQTPVTFNVSGPGGSTGSFGSLSTYNPGYLSSPSPGTATQIPVNAHNFCDPSGAFCYFLALLWSPSTMPVNSANLNAGIFQNIVLNVTATQGSASYSTGLLLEPPPLVLVHGIWSSAAEAWPPFEQWLNANYPNNLIFPADYGKYNYLNYSDPPIQNIMEGTVLNALAGAANRGVVAREVDVVAHSMGGLVTRWFTQAGPPYPLSYLPFDPVHQLVTVGTPQAGSPLATTLWNNQNTVEVPNPPTTSIVDAACIFYFASSPCTLGGLFGKLGMPVSTGVQSLQGGLPLLSSEVYNSIVGQAPESSTPPSPGSTTENILNTLLGAFVPGATDYGILGGYPNDTIVPGSSQSSGAAQTATISGIVHTNLCDALGTLLCSDEGETASPCVWAQAAFWLMGGSGPDTSVANCSIAPPNPILDLTGYTQVPASNVTFSPATGSALTIDSATNIAVTSSTKTVIEVLLFQTVSDPTDTLLLYNTQSPFSIAFTPTRLGSTTFIAFVLFSDMTYATTTLNYTFQLSGNALALNLVNSPVASLPVGSSAIVGAQALFSNGPVDVSQAATYAVRSGTTNVFSVDSTGTVTATGPGTDWLDASYGGLIASTEISVGTCTYSLSPTNQLVNDTGGMVSVQVTTQSGCSWTADTGGATWLTTTSASGGGSGTITLTAAANTSGATQTAIVTVANQDVSVIQPATSCSYVLSQTQVTIPAAGGTGTIGVTTSCPILVSSDAPWLSAVPLNGSVNYSAAANTTGAARSATLTIGTQTVSATQPAAPAATSTTLSSSANPSTVGQSVTFTATVTSAMAGTPTGTVTFLDGNTSLGTGTLNGSAEATFSTSSLTAGQHSMTASYGGDSNFAASISAVLTETVNGAPDFSLSISPASQNVSPGQSAAYTLTLTPANGFNQSVSISCSGAPAEASCIPASSPVPMNGTSTSQVQINVTTTGNTFALRWVKVRFPGGEGGPLTLALILCILTLWVGLQRNSQAKHYHFILYALVILLAAAVAGCSAGGSSSGGKNSGTPPGTYTLTLTGSAGNTTHSTTVSLVVQ